MFTGEVSKRNHDPPKFCLSAGLVGWRRSGQKQHSCLFQAIPASVRRAAPRRQKAPPRSPRRRQTLPIGRPHDLPRFTKVLCKPGAPHDPPTASECHRGLTAQGGLGWFWRRKCYLGRGTAGYEKVVLLSLRRLKMVATARSHGLPRFTKVCCQPEAFSDS